MNQLAPLTRILADCAWDIAQRPLPDTIGDQAKLCLLDFAASVLAGAGSLEAATAATLLPSFGAGNCSLIARTERTSVVGASFYHGLVATVADMDDSHRFASGLHLSATTLPVTLALGEERNSPSDALLRAIAAGYEVSSRICRAADSGLRARGFHSTGAVGAFGACAAAGVLLGLDRDRMAHGLGIAASGGGGTFAFLGEGAPVRHVHAAWASVNGLSAALLAAAGMTGPTWALEDSDGFFAAYAGSYDEGFIVAPPPSESGTFEINNAYRKLFNACGHSLPSITAALEIREDLIDRLDDVEQIEVRSYPAAAKLINSSPGTVGEAKFSLPCIVALALIFGDVTAHEMRMEVLSKPEVRRLAAKVNVVEDPAISADFPRLRASELRVSLRDGSRINKYVDAAIGLPENPARLDQLVQKFVDNAQDHLSADSIDVMIGRAMKDRSARQIVEILSTAA